MDTPIYSLPLRLPYPVNYVYVLLSTIAEILHLGKKMVLLRLCPFCFFICNRVAEVHPHRISFKKLVKHMAWAFQHIPPLSCGCEEA